MIGFPLLVKAVAGGGGKGMRLVGAADEFEGAFPPPRRRRRRRSATGRCTSRSTQPARHVEIQVLADANGGILTLGERECSIQRRHQKLIEESPSPALDRTTREAMESAAEAAARAIGYRTPARSSSSSARRRLLLHRAERPAPGRAPGDEPARGLDLVREQPRVAAGAPLPLQGRAPRRGHAIECRINAEDPRRDFAPAPGRIEALRVPLGPGVRFDTHISRRAR